MSVVEASESSESTDDSVQYIGSTNPLVEGEVLTENPEEEEHWYSQAEIEAADRWMQENTIPEPEENAGQQPVGPEPSTQPEQQPEPVTAAQTTEQPETVTQRSGSAASAEEPSSAEKSAEKGKDRESEDSRDREIRKLREKFSKKKEQLKEARKRKREAEERALKLSEERNAILQREIAELRARSTPAPSEVPGTAPAQSTTPEQPAQPPATSPATVQQTPTAEPSVITSPVPEEQTGKKRGRPRKGKAERDAEKAQKAKEDAEKAREIGAALGKEVIPLGPPKSTGKTQQLRENLDKAHKQHGKGSFGARGSPVFGSPGAGPSSSPSPSTSRTTVGERIVSEQDLDTARTIAKETDIDLEGRETRKAKGKGALDALSVTLYQHREALPVIARGTLHTIGFQNQLDYVGHLNRLGTLQQPVDTTRGVALNWQATIALEILSGWRGQANLIRATLESIVREKGGGKYEKYC